MEMPVLSMTLFLFACFPFLVGSFAYLFGTLLLKKLYPEKIYPSQLIFFSTLYIICTPPFTIYVGWASCFEQFIANTAGLLSGYILYSSIKYQNDRITISFLAAALSILFGVVSLFTYQNGFGCFLIPFALHLIKAPQTFPENTYWNWFLSFYLCGLLFII